mmetsp:Transcript_28138/g.57629  ORF Transcript_28138/g.57629 Transcript_28138/m.57629 type:complete len:105 (-) Transcript_28138:316-630(-)
MTNAEQLATMSNNITTDQSHATLLEEGASKNVQSMSFAFAPSPTIVASLVKEATNDCIGDNCRCLLDVALSTILPIGDAFRDPSGEPGSACPFVRGKGEPRLAG